MTVFELLRELSKNDDPNQQVVFGHYYEDQDQERIVSRVLFSKDWVHLDDGD